MNKSSDTLEKIAVFMADNLYSPIDPTIYAGKVSEEMRELIDELEGLKQCKYVPYKTSPGGATFYDKDLTTEEKIKDECADVIFTVLRLSNALGFNLNDLLHYATAKMYGRVKNPNYNKV